MGNKRIRKENGAFYIYIIYERVKISQLKKNKNISYQPKMISFMPARNGRFQLKLILTYNFCLSLRRIMGIRLPEMLLTRSSGVIQSRILLNFKHGEGNEDGFV